MGGEGRVGDKRVRTEGVWGVHISLRGKPVGPLAVFLSKQVWQFLRRLHTCPFRYVCVYIYIYIYVGTRRTKLRERVGPFQIVFVYICIVYLLFIFVTISPCTTGLKALYVTHPDCTSTAQTL